MLTQSIFLYSVIISDFGLRLATSSCQFVFDSMWGVHMLKGWMDTGNHLECVPLVTMQVFSGGGCISRVVCSKMSSSDESALVHERNWSIYTIFCLYLKWWQFSQFVLFEKWLLSQGRFRYHYLWLILRQGTVLITT